MTPRERYFSALAGDMPDRIPLNVWQNHMPGGEDDDQLLALDIGLIIKTSVWQQSYHGVTVETSETATADGSTLRRTVFHTPAGDLTTIERVMPGTTWIEKYPFTNENDYDALEALVSGRSYEPYFDQFKVNDAIIPGQSIARPLTIHSPMHELIYEFMGIEAFGIQWYENQDRVLRLCDVLKRDWRQRIEIVASSPAKFAVIEGNTQLSVIGPERFEKYYLPTIEEGCEILHAKGIFAGAHLDGDNKMLAPLIARTSLDFIEAFTPPPECDFSIAEARDIWPDKALLVHFPSSLHLYGIDAMQAHAREFIRQAAPGAGFAFVITEDIPNGGRGTLVPLFRFINKYGSLPWRINAG